MKRLILLTVLISLSAAGAAPVRTADFLHAAYALENPHVVYD